MRMLVQQSARFGGAHTKRAIRLGPDAGVLRGTDKCETHARTHSAPQIKSEAAIQTNWLARLGTTEDGFHLKPEPGPTSFL